MCGRIFLSVLTAVFATLAILYQLYLGPVLQVGGRGRVVPAARAGRCRPHKDLQACKKLVFHEPSGLVYAACSTPYLRTLWLPNQGLTNSTGAGKDYLAVFDPSAGTSKHLPLVRFDTKTGLSTSGFDVVSATDEPNHVFVYAINNRKSEGHILVDGPNSVVEVFKSDASGFKLSYIMTVKDPLIGMPNDIIGSPDGKSFFLTTEAKTKGSWGRFADILFGRENTFVTWCHVEDGCKVVARRLRTASGIARGPQGEIYIANMFASSISVFEEQSDHSLMLTDTIPVGGGALDGISVDADGTLFVSELPKVFSLKFQHLKDPKHAVPSSALKITLNTDESSYYGQKYKVETLFEDSGKIASGMTTVVHDKDRNKLYMHGVAAPWLVQCDEA